jgi:hypothetical protein
MTWVKNECLASFIINMVKWFLISIQSYDSSGCNKGAGTHYCTVLTKKKTNFNGIWWQSVCLNFKCDVTLHDSCNNMHVRPEI